MYPRSEYPFNDTLSKARETAPYTTLICGHFALAQDLRHTFLSSLPQMLHIRNNEPAQTERMLAITNLIIQESARQAPGSAIIVEKLAEVLLVHIFRVYVVQSDHQNGFSRALTHPQIVQSLNAIHKEPAFPWTLELLAREAGLSRTGFAVLFKQLTGSTPMQYCLNWRMTLAHKYLRDTIWSIPELAERVGYRSEAAFIRAFKRSFSVTPGFVRRNAQRS